MYYHRFDNLDELLNEDLAAKIGRGILSKDLWIENVTVIFHLKSTASVFTKVNYGINV